VEGPSFFPVIAHPARRPIHPPNRKRSALSLLLLTLFILFPDTWAYLAVPFFSRLQINAKKIMQRPSPSGLIPSHNRFANLLQAGRFGRK
jgi:hypothetical protein